MVAGNSHSQLTGNFKIQESIACSFMSKLIFITGYEMAGFYYFPYKGTHTHTQIEK